MDRKLREKLKGMKKSEQAKLIGQTLAEPPRAKGSSPLFLITVVIAILDRVKAFADGAHEKRPAVDVVR